MLPTSRIRKCAAIALAALCAVLLAGPSGGPTALADSGSITQTTVSDFTACAGETLTGTTVTEDSDGEIALNAGIEAYFRTPATNPPSVEGFTTGTYQAADFVISGGNLTITATDPNGGGYIVSTATQQYGVLDGVVTFSEGQSMHFGWADAPGFGAWAMFSTSSTTNQLFARTFGGGANNDAPLGTLPTGPTRFRITWDASGDGDVINYYVGDLVTPVHTETTNSPLPDLPVTLSNDSKAGQGRTLTADWIRATPYAMTSGSYTSCPLSAPDSLSRIWGNVSWADDVSNGTDVTVGIRTADTIGGLSGPFTTVTNGGTTVKLPGKFVQYRVNLNSPSTDSSPRLDEITLNYVDLPTLSIDNVSVTEGNSGQTNADFTVSLSFAIGADVTVTATTANDTATAGSDYTSNGATVTILAGQTSTPFQVTVNGDTTFEPDETFVVNLTSPSNATIADSQGTGTITNDDTQPMISIDNVSVTEGNSSQADATFTISLSNRSYQPISVQAATADGTATTADGDYASNNLTVSIPAGQLNASFTVKVNGDTTFEPDETFVVNLTSPSNATIADSQGLGTITNDDPQPTISIDNVSVTEGNSSQADATFTISLSNRSYQPISVQAATADGTATTADGDYASNNLTVSIPANQTSANFTVKVNGDNKFEPNETFVVNLTSPSNATIADNQGTGTITNDDSQPTISIDDVAVTEGNSSQTDATFTVSLSGPSNQTITVDYATANATATDGVDYVGLSDSLTFNPGDVSKTITVKVNGDRTFEPNETFFLNLSSPSNATIADDQGLGTINNDDPVPTISIDDASRIEGNNGTAPMTLTVSLSNPSYQTVTVKYATANGSAVAPDDYTAASGTVTFAPGETIKPIGVQVKGDTAIEANESFVVNLSDPTNATIARGQGVGTITNDDGQVTVSIGNASVSEGDNGFVMAIFTVNLSIPSTTQVTVNYATADGTAVAPADYVATSGTLTFTPGQTSKTIIVSVRGDTQFEPDETFTVQLSNPSGTTIARGTGNGLIINDDTQRMIYLPLIVR